MVETDCTHYETADGDCLTNACGGCCVKYRAELDNLRAEVERLRKALRASAWELQYIADCDPCDKLHQTAEGRACAALAERIIGPMFLWPDEPNLTAPAEEEGK